MQTVARRDIGGVLGPIGWWAAALGLAVYGAFALAMGGSELLFVLGRAAEMKHRVMPVVFVVHAFAGTMALLIGPLQSVRGIRRRAGVRRNLGRTYVAAVWVASLAAAVDAMAFGVNPAAKIVFLGAAALWFTTTTIGMLEARARRYAAKHEWMIRSYSLTLFFVTFSLWVPALAATPLSPDVAYPLALFLSAALNFGAADVWIRRARRKTAHLWRTEAGQRQTGGES